MSFPDFRNFLILIRDWLFTRCLLAPHISLFFCRREVNLPMSIIIKCFWFHLWTKAIYLLSFSIGVPLQESRNTISCTRIRILQKSHLLLDSNSQSQHLLREVDMSVVLACGHAFICCVFFSFVIWGASDTHTKGIILKQVPCVSHSANWDVWRWRRGWSEVQGAWRGCTHSP